jgi:hypothetical protein
MNRRDRTTRTERLGWVFASCIAVAAPGVACGSAGSSGFATTGSHGPDSSSATFDADAGADTSAGDDDAARLFSDGAVTDAEAPNDGSSTNCTPSATSYIYVGTVDNELYKLDPVKLAFSDLGNMSSCPQVDAQSGFCSALAIDRQGMVWINYNTGGGVGSETAIYELDPSTMSCTLSLFDPTGAPSIFDMSFATAGTGSNDETLFLSLAGEGLGYFDATWTIHTVPETSDTLYASNFDLQGTADGLLFGLDVYGQSTPAYLGQIDRTTGAVSKTYSLPGVYTTYGTAFGYWGGKFWIFGNETYPDSSNVQVYDPATNTVTTALSNVGFTIDAAGVSTCAPPTTPQ